MAGDLEFAEPVRRWLRVRSGEDQDDPPFELDDDGFLPDPTADEPLRMGAGMVRPEDAVVGRGALVLLGEPGAGKTTTFARLTDADRSAGEPEPGSPGTVWITGSELGDSSSFNEVLGEHLAALPLAGAAEPLTATLTIVLDQLDEAANLFRLPARLKRALNDKDTRALRFLIACRTADYPEGLTRVLEQALGACVVVDLAPLTRDDVATLAAGTDVDATAFVAAVVRAGVGTLANTPLTLKVLLAAFRQEADALSRTPRELFEAGVTQLVDEHDRGRAIKPFATTTVEERLVIAGRIATRMLLCGQRTIWCGEAAQAGPEDITEGMLARGREIAAGSFEVSPLAVGETLRTALFSRSGTNRVAFAHSSFAAFLAARYLTARSSADPDAQRGITGIFLVAAPDEETASIPIHLRETAAWMLAHIPGEHLWLATADPEGLIAHGAYITDFATRAAMVDGLLRRAGEVELSERSWHRTWWRLTHPGLAGQLTAVLTSVLTTGSEEWQDFAAASLAIRFALDGEVAEVTELLLKVAEAPKLAPALRNRAIKASMAINPTMAAPRLRSLLASLAPGTNADDDSEELVGTILSELWPEHLDLADVLPHLRPVRADSVIGMYRWHLWRLPGDVAEPDLSALLTHATHLVDQLLAPPAGSDASEPTNFSPDLSRSPTLDDVLAPIFDRITVSPSVEEYLPVLGRQVSRLLLGLARVPVPLGVDLVDESGKVTTSSIDVRRSFAEAVILALAAEVAEFDRYHAHLVLWEWKSTRHGPAAPQGLRRGDRTYLLDDSDFAWLLGRVDELRGSGEHKQADAIGLVAASVADLYNPSTFELAYARRGTPEGEHFAWAFDGVALDSALAEAMRRNTPKEKPWEHADAFASRQRDRLQSAVAGDANAFWRLTRDLRADVATGQFDAFDSDDPRILPGASLWAPDDFVAAFSVAARQFLDAENDHRDEWLGTQTRDYRAEAGYAALVVLHDNGSLDDISDRWAAWVGAVLDKAHRAATARDSSLLRDLISRAGTHAATELVAAICTLVGGSLARGEAPWALAEIMSSVPAAVHSALVKLADNLRAALDSSDGSDGPFTVPDTVEGRRTAANAWATLLHEPLLAGNAAALNQVEEALGHEMTEDDALWAAAAGRLLLLADPERFWPRIRQTLTISPAFSKDLAFASAQTYRLNDFTESLPDRELVEAWRWLADVCPPETDVFREGWVPPERSVHDWRNAMLNVLSRRGTQESVLGIRSLVESFPNDLRLQAALVSARRQAQARATVLLKPQQVVELLADPGRRVIRTPLQLAKLLTEVLTEIERDLPTHSNLLWDCEREPKPTGSPKWARRPLVWRPKLEGALAAYLAHELTIRLVRRAVVINREVVVKPTDAGDSGERPDLLVQAIAVEGELDTAEIVSVPVEIKGSWHAAVSAAQRDQLANRYLPAEKTDAGVYVVGWYPIDLWSAQDRNPKANARKLIGPEPLLESLRSQAGEIFKEHGRRTLPYVLTITRAAPS
ncbi:hypothetical protein AB0878_46420 [Amycolatopsis sp. NPDC047767]|uniref:NACHT domain-containing protein n=1 Tax=Amycolatopsis sp. NPDC047767 TaxID=3156765 RepID=UPI00345236B8